MPPLSGLHSLAELDLTDCNIMELPSDIDSSSSLIHLKLSRNKFSTLPASVSVLPQLKIIELESCKKLQALPELPSYRVWTNIFLLVPLIYASHYFYSCDGRYEG